MAADLTIGVRLTADSSGVVRGLTLTEQELEKLAQRIRRASDDTTRINSQFNLLHSTLNKLTGVLAGAFAVDKITDFVKSVVDAQVQFQRIGFILQGASGSAAAASKEFGFVQELSDKLGLSLTDMAQGYAQLASSAFGAGVQSQDLHREFTALSEAFLATGRSGDEVNRFLIQLEQGFSLGKFQMIDFRAMAQSMNGVLEDATEAMKGSGKSLQQWLQQGGVPAAMFLERYADVLHAKYGKTAEAASQGLLAALNRLKNALFEMKAEAAEGGFLDSITASIKDLTDKLKDPSFKKSLADAIGLVGKIALAAVNAADAFDRFGKAIGESVAKAQGFILPEDKIKQLKDWNTYLLPGDPQLAKNNAEIAKLQAQIDSINSMVPAKRTELAPVTVHASKLPPVPDNKKIKPFQDPADAILGNLGYNYYFKDFDAEVSKLQSAADKIRASIMTPVEKTNQQFEELRKLHSSHALNDEDYFLAVEKTQSDFDKLNKSSNDFVDSLKKSLDPMQALQDAAGQMTSQLVDGLTDAIVSGKSFGKVMENIASEIGNMIVKIFIMFAMQKAMQGIAAMGAPSFDFVPLPSAKGNVFDGSGLVAFANGGVVDQPTFFGFGSGRLGLMGESGAEGVLPLRRMANGKLGVHADGGGVTVNVINNSQSQATAQSRRGPDGRQTIDVLVEDSFKRLLGAGRLDTALAANAGTKRPGRF